MNRFLLKVSLTINNTIRYCYFLIQLLFNSSSRLEYKGKNSKTVAVLANGPSLKDEISRIGSTNEFKNIDDFIVMNYMAFDDVFFKIKPKHYCLADPMFFSKSHRIKEVRKLYAIFNSQVDWNMNIYIPAHYYNLFTSFSNIKNRNLHIIKVNSPMYMGFSKYRNFYYKKGMSCPRIQTVAILAIYIGINIGYNTIRLYGMDHNFFKSLYINEENQLCNIDTHFYDNKKTQLKPILMNETGKVWKISEYLEDRMYMFKSHDELAEYANYLNTELINCTPGSMIDSYRRNANNKNVFDNNQES